MRHYIPVKAAHMDLTETVDSWVEQWEEVELLTGQTELKQSEWKPAESGWIWCQHIKDLSGLLTSSSEGRIANEGLL